MAALVALHSIVKRYAAPEILAGIDLEIESGASLAIVGPSGSGKSTLLHIIGALLPPTSGRVEFDGTDLATLSADELAHLRNTGIGFVFQSHHLLPQLTAVENVLVPALVVPDRAGASERARALLDGVGLGDRMSHRPSQLSGGECQRVAVARALINRPRLVLADEPTGSLDAKAAGRLATLLCDLNDRETVALVTVTHSLELAARMKTVYELREGKLMPAEANA